MKVYTNDVFYGTVDVTGKLSANGSALVGTTGAAVTPMVVKGAAAQTATLQEWQDSTGAALATVNQLGGFSGISFGSVTASKSRMYTNQASGALGILTQAAANIGLYIQGAASQTADLQRWLDPAGANLASVSAAGVVSAAAVQSAGAVSGSQFQAVAAAGPYAIVDGTRVIVVNRTAVGNIPFVIQGMAAQTGDLQRWQDSGGTVLAKVTANGTISGAYFQNAAGTGPFIDPTSYNSVRVLNRIGGNVAHVPLMVDGISGQTADLQQWRDNTGVTLARVTAAGVVSSPGILATSPAVGSVPVTVKGFASQTGDLQQWQDSAGVVKARVNSAGNFQGAFFTSIDQVGTYINLDRNSAVFLNQNSAANVVVKVRGMASQTGDLQQWLDSSGAVIARIKAVAAQTGTPAAATDLATALTLVNDLRAKLLALGLVS